MVYLELLNRCPMIKLMVYFAKMSVESRAQKRVCYSLVPRPFPVFQC